MIQDLAPYRVGRHVDIPKLLNTNDNSYFNSRNAMMRTLIRIMTLEQFTKISMTQGHIYMSTEWIDNNVEAEV